MHHHVLFDEADLPGGTGDTDKTIKMTRFNEHFMFIIIVKLLTFKIVSAFVLSWLHKSWWWCFQVRLLLGIEMFLHSSCKENVSLWSAPDKAGAWGDDDDDDDDLNHHDHDHERWGQRCQWSRRRTSTLARGRWTPSLSTQAILLGWSLWIWRWVLWFPENGRCQLDH